MFSWLKKLLGLNPEYAPHPTKDELEEVVSSTGTLWKRRRRPPSHSWLGRGKVPMYDYWCPECGTRLREGPSGGIAVNAVCGVCGVNYGCLPDYYGD